MKTIMEKLINENNSEKTNKNLGKKIWKCFRKINIYIYQNF